MGVTPTVLSLRCHYDTATTFAIIKTSLRPYQVLIWDDLVTILPCCVRLSLRPYHAAQDITASLPRSCHDQTFYIYTAVFSSQPSVVCMIVIMGDRLDLILHDLLLLQAQQAELDVEAALLLVRRRRRKRQRRPKTVLFPFTGILLMMNHSA